MHEDLQPETATSEWSTTLIGYEPCTEEYHASEWNDVERAYADAVAAGEKPRLVKSSKGKFSVWVHANPFFNEMSDIEKARILRDEASRRLTGKEHALCCAICEGIHLKTSGEWKSKRDFKAFQKLCAQDDLQPFFNPPQKSHEQ